MTSIIKVNTIQDAGGNQILGSNGSGTFTTNFSTGKLLQIQSASLSGSTVNISSTSYTDIGLSDTITPASTSSKILIIVSLSGRMYRETNADRLYYFSIVRDSTTVYSKNTDAVQMALGAGSVATNPIMDHLSFVDSPSSTSSLTYKIQCKMNDTGSNTKIAVGGDSGVSHITLMEIGA